MLLCVVYGVEVVYASQEHTRTLAFSLVKTSQFLAHL